ncbi:protein-disulfide reductase DsbD, partial [Vibrio alfacsensis]
MYRILSPFILLFAIAFSTPSWALFGNSNNAPAFAPNTANTFVPVDEAFPMNFYQQGNKVFIDWQVKEDY